MSRRRPDPCALSHRERLIAACVLLPPLLSALVAPCASAASRFWLNPDSFNAAFGSTNNWSATSGGPGGASVPGPSDFANFDLDATYDVNFATTNRTNINAKIVRGNVTFDLCCFSTYTLTNPVAVQIGEAEGETAALTVVRGTLTVDTDGDSISVASFRDTVGVLTVSMDGRIGLSSGIRPDIEVGNAGTATMTIHQDGQVFGRAGFIGNFEGGQGTATVNGFFAGWSLAEFLAIGRDGSGALNIVNGGTVHAASVMMGGTATGSGVANITGTDSDLISAGNLTVGNNGAGTMNISAGGRVESVGGILGDNANGIAGPSVGVVSVSGAGSAWDNSGALTVGRSGKGTLNISAGGRVTCEDLTVGFALSNGEVAVNGAGSLLSATGAAVIGRSDAKITVSNGGSLETMGGATLGISSERSGDVTVTGNNSVWSNTGALTVADLGSATITLTNGGALNTTSLTINDPAGENLGTVNLNGGSITTTNLTRAGGVLNHTDGTLTIHGGVFDNVGADLALNGADSNDLPTLRMMGGADAPTLSTAALRVGTTRRGALQLSGDSDLAVASLILGESDGSNGTVTVGGSGTTLTATNVTFGDGTGTIAISPGGTVSSTNAVVLNTGGTIHLDGGTLDANLTDAGGQVVFNSGTLRAKGAVTANGNDYLELRLGPQRRLLPGQTLSFPSSFTLGNLGEFTVDGGVLQANSLVLTRGASAEVLSGTIDLTAGLTIQEESSLHIGGGVIDLGASLTNNGELNLDGESTAFAGASVINNGILRGRGRVNIPLINDASGAVRVASSQNLALNSVRASENNGLIDVNGGQFEMTAELKNGTTNPSTAMISARNAILHFADGVSNSGAMVFSTGATDVFGDVTNANAPAAGRIVVSGGGVVHFYDDVINNGSIQVSAAGGLESTTVFFGSLSGNGVSGAGNVFIEGDARPGASPGTMAFGGNVSFGALSTLKIELGGLLAGDQYDNVEIAGAASLAGKLDVSLIGGFFPNSVGQSFTVMSFADRIGEFDAVNLPLLPNRLDWQLLYGEHDLRLFVTRLAIPGDTDDDGDVDLSDLNNVRNNFGTTGLPVLGDTTPFDGDVDLDDLNAVRNSFGAAQPGPTSVPEPAAWTLASIAMGCTTLPAARARRRS